MRNFPHVAIDISSVEGVIVCTQTPDYLLPSDGLFSALVHENLGIREDPHSCVGIGSVVIKDLTKRKIDLEALLLCMVKTLIRADAKSIFKAISK
jgi:hypothetical protein